MVANTQAQSAQQQIASNLQNRAALISSGLHMIKKLPVATGNLGDAMQITLERMGIMTGITLEFTVPVDITAAATQSPFGPFNFAKLLTYTDYAGVNRIQTQGFQLHALNAFRAGRPPDQSAKNAGYLAASETGIDTNILNFPTAVSSSDSITFSLYVPCAYDPMSDLRGAVLAQTIYGDHYVTIQLPSSLVGSDELMSPYSAGTVALQSGTQVSVQAYQHYIMPQNGVNNLPVIDLSTIYAVEGNYQDGSNIASGQSKYVNWPNNRAILSALHVFDNGGSPVANGADLSAITLLGNSNTNIRELTPRLLRKMQRMMIGSDFPAGVYFMSSRAQPITTQLYGNVQTKFDVVTANTSPYMLSQYESFYMAGTPLPGVIQ